MYEKVKHYCKEHNIVKQDGRVVIGISGGPDSVCLLDILHRMKEENHLFLCAVHIHHGLRGEKADQDEAFTRELCKRYDIPYYCFQEEVEQRAKEQKISIEEAGRLCRYERMEQVRQETHSDSIAVAHHGNDQAETVLFHLVRGSGLTGLVGMKPVRDRIIRPLLCSTKQEILSYLEKRNLSYRMDETNEQLIYARNQIRNTWIPLMEQMNEGAVTHICQTASLVNLATSYIKQQVHESFQKSCMEKTSKHLVLSVDCIKGQHPYLQLEVLKYVIGQMIGQQDVGFTHMEAVQMLLKSETGKQVTLPEKLIVKKEYNVLRFIKGEECQSETLEYDYELAVPSHQVIQEIEGKLILNIKQAQELWGEQHNFNEIISKDPYKKMFDYDKIKGRLHIRTRRSQDKIKIGMNTGHKSLKRFFIDEKIPRQQRGQIPILADEEGILWVLGYRIGSEYKVECTTKRVLIVEYVRKTKENKDG